MELYYVNPSRFPNLTFHGQDGVGIGWKYILEYGLAELDNLAKDGEIHVMQIKEKFGELRVYVNGRAGVFDIVDRMELESMTTCEECGSQGKRRGGSWIKTLCDACHAAKEKR